MPVFPSPVSVPRDNRDESSRRKGASSITRSICSITAAEPATSPTAPPATTTCATSWMVDPAYTPNACSPSPRCGYSHGYRNIPVVPNTTTVATATDTLCACARTTGSVAITAAAPQIALPAPISIRSEEHTSELQPLMRISYAVFCLKKKKKKYKQINTRHQTPTNIKNNS